VSEVVIGEAVVLDVRPARLPSRAVAFAVDVLIMGVVLVGVVLAITAAGDDFDDALSATVALVMLVGVLVGYPLLWETLTRGRSPGKYAMGLRVVRDDGGPIVFRHALARSLAGLIIDFGILSGFTGVIAVVVSLSSVRGKRVGDLLAGTVVVRERVPGGRVDALPPADPRLAAWATGCELSGLPDDLALAGRQFLVRAPQLAVGVRASLAERLATDVAARTAPAPPAGVPAEEYLRAVLGERRRRETARLAGAAAPPPPGRWTPPPPPPPAYPPPPAVPTSARPPAQAAPAVPETTGGFAPPG
jgi:uncharacterized RDD family membrane protein YckC